MRVYLDGLIGLNFLVDFLLLMGTNRMTGFPADLKRVAAAAALGAVYAGACLLPGFHFLGNMLWRTVSLGLMGCIAFGISPSALRRCGVFALLTLALGGFAVSVGRADPAALLLSALLLWGLCRFSVTSPPGSREYLPLEICRGDKRIKLLALRDTGNTLRDPVTGEQVLVICAGAARQLTGLTEEQLRDPLGTLTAEPIPGLRLIPYRTVGQGGMMLAMAFEEVLLEGKRERRIVAFSAEDFGWKEGYQALTGGAMAC